MSHAQGNDLAASDRNDITYFSLRLLKEGEQAEDGEFWLHIATPGDYAIRQETVNDMRAADPEANSRPSESPTTPTPTENTDIEQILDAHAEYYIRETMKFFQENGVSPALSRNNEGDLTAKAAIEQKLNAEILKARDSEQNTLFSIMRHLHIKHDAKAIMRVRKEWDESAALQASKEGK